MEFRTWYRQPAREWLEALPLGNGRLAAMLWGGHSQERADLNIDTLWSGGPRSFKVENAAALLAQLRSAVLERRAYAEADQLALGLQGSFNESYQPLGWLTVGVEGGEPVRNYERSLDLQRGLASVRYQAGESWYEREAFVSAPDRALVVHFRVRGPARLDLVLDLGSPHPHERSNEAPALAWLEGRAPVHVVPDYWDRGPAVVYDEGAGTRFVAGLAVGLVGGSARPVGSGRVVVKGGEAVTVLVTAASGYAGYGEALAEDRDELQQACREVLHRLLADSYEAVRERHIADHRELFDRCWLQLGPQRATEAPTDERLQAARDGVADEGLCALLFHFGRYLLMASSRPGSQPANLQGVWNAQVRPPWSCNWTTNINVEMNYWPAETTNLAECHMPLMELVADLAKAGESTAAGLYGCRGWVAHHNVDLWRSTWPTGDQEAHPYWVNWQMGGAWLCQHLWEHYAFSEDRSFLERAYPVMRAAAIFLLDYLVEGPGGRLVTCPSTSPENRFTTADGSEAAVSAASTMDMWLTRDLFRHCIAASQVLGVDEAWRGQLQDALGRLYVPQVAADGRLQEWWEDFSEPEPGHRHLSHLFCLYPGDEVTPASTPALASAARRSLEHRLANGSGGPGWSRAWVAGLWARLGEGWLAGESLHAVVERALADNLFSSPHPGLFQIDANFGVTAAIAEMLVQSHTGTVHLLPALPPSWPEGQVAGLRARGGLTVGIRWAEGRVQEAYLEVPSPRTIRLRCATLLRLEGDQPTGAKLAPGEAPGATTLEAPVPGLYTLAGEA